MTLGGAWSARGGVFVEEPAPAVQRAKRGDIARGVVCVEPVPVERPGKMNESARSIEPDDQIDILPDRQGRIVAAHGIEAGFAKQRARCRGVVSAPQQLRDAALLFHGRIVFQNLVSFIDLIAVAMHQHRFCRRFEKSQRLLQKCRFPQIVLVQKRHVGALRQARAGISGGGLSAVLRMAHVADLRDGLHQGVRAVRRSIVYDDDLGGGQGLPAHGVDGFRQISGGAVVCGNDDADPCHEPEFLVGVNR